MQHDLTAWLKLHHTRLGPVLLHKLLEHYGSAENICRAKPAELLQLGVKQNRIEHLQSDNCSREIDSALDWVQQPQNHILTIADDEYPPLLKSIHGAPPLLYVRGNHQLLCEPQLAIIGSRNPSRSGEENAHIFAKHLAQTGLIITSGLALGIDGAAHRGALDAKAPTLAVMATGIDRVYPAKHRSLAENILQKGALITELPPGTEPRPELFPQRNRIISGLAYGVLVVEAAERSGSLITAHYAMEQAREVFAIPGSIHNPMSRGCHRLIRQGAKLVESIQDILEEIAPQLKQNLQIPTQPPTPPKTGDTELGQDYTDLLAVIDHDPIPIDRIAERSGLPVGSVASMLLILELQGFVQAESGARYRKVI